MRILVIIAIAIAGAVFPPGQAHAQSTPLPSTGDVAAVMADADRRGEALYRIVVLARYLERWRSSGSAPAAEALQEDFEWLNHLRARYGEQADRSPVLDPAAWRTLLELRDLGMSDNSLVSPLGPGLEVYLRQVFDRSDERLAWAILPELLWSSGPQATVIWEEWLEMVAAADESDANVAGGYEEWMSSWVDADPDESPAGDLLEDVTRSMEVLASSATAEGPPYHRHLSRVRYLLLSAMPGLGAPQRGAAASFLRLADMIDGLHEGRYFSFAEGLLALAGELLLRSLAGLPAEPLLANWLDENLPDISARYAREFSLVDPHVNSALAASFDVVRSVASMTEENRDSETLQRKLGDAAAQLTLLMPDLDYYFDLPVRDSIAGGIDACIGIVARQEADGSPSMTRELYDDCQQTIVELADSEARDAALAGDPDGPFGDEALRRELNVTSSQRLNYGIGYLHERYSTGCEQPDNPLPNPLEWSTLATLLTWFAEQSPDYFQTAENEARLVRMKEIGDELLRVLSEQVDCFAGAGAAVNDPVSRSLEDYHDALVALGSGINGAVFDFRGELLAEGADIVLQRDASQATAYRPDDLMIGPCDPENVCEMTDELTSTRALLGLFPDQYLVADQSGLGNIEICYDSVSWVNRRSEQVRADDTNVANYYGQLEFELIGRYRVGNSVDEVFGFRFTSPAEHHYLFAAATEEVLQDSCPVEWIGERIVTPLRSDRGGIVPNRLTYLSAPRMLPSRLLAGNWDSGAEWRDWFITGIGVKRLKLEPPDDISAALNRHLQEIHRAEQAAIYRSVLQPESRSDDAIVESLYEEAIRLSTIKALIRHQLMAFYPHLLVSSDELRSAIAGHGGLLDSAMLLRFRNDNVPVNTINGLALGRLGLVREEWALQSEAIRRTGTIARGLAHAMMRLNALYFRYFTEPRLVADPD